MNTDIMLSVRFVYNEDISRRNEQITAYDASFSGEKLLGGSPNV
jgi:hypothetical protein